MPSDLHLPPSARSPGVGGGADAWAELIALYGTVYNLAFHFAGSAPDADDLPQRSSFSSTRPPLLPRRRAHAGGRSPVSQPVHRPHRRARHGLRAVAVSEKCWRGAPRVRSHSRLPKAQLRRSTAPWIICPRSRRGRLCAISRLYARGYRGLLTSPGDVKSRLHRARLDLGRRDHRKARGSRGIAPAALSGDVFSGLGPLPCPLYRAPPSHRGPARGTLPRRSACAGHAPLPRAARTLAPCAPSPGRSGVPCPGSHTATTSAACAPGCPRRAARRPRVDCGARTRPRRALSCAPARPVRTSLRDRGLATLATVSA